MFERSQLRLLPLVLVALVLRPSLLRLRRLVLLQIAAFRARRVDGVRSWPQLNAHVPPPCTPFVGVPSVHFPPYGCDS